MMKVGKVEGEELSWMFRYQEVVGADVPLPHPHEELDDKGHREKWLQE
jgi:hypothetical protein